MELNVIHLATVTSTQDVARAMTPRRVGAVIIADVQEKGRGRRGHVWLSPRGGLYVSIVMRSDPLLSLRAGIAVARALQKLGIEARLKWPNDVLVHEKKIAGILIEASEEMAIVGIGVNIDSVPLPEATCVECEAKRSVTRDEVLQSILQEIETACGEDIIKTYRELCCTIGRKVRIITAAGKEIMGNALGIDRDGHLLVDDGKNKHMIVGGDCEHLDAGV